MRNAEFKLQECSYCVSDIEDFIKYIIKKLKILTILPPIHVYINSTNKLVFKIKDGYKTELQTSVTNKIIS